MEKVYKSTDDWFVKDLSDLYSFRCVNTDTGEERNLVLNWTKDNTSEEKAKLDFGIQSDVRIYTVEVDNLNINFLLKYESSQLLILQLDLYEMNRWRNETGWNFVGDIDPSDPSL
jgi:hypothetical protein